MPNKGRKEGKTNMAMEFKVEFHWFDDNWEEVKDTVDLDWLHCLDDCFIRVYNRAVEALNPCYPVWNKLFNEQYAGKTYDCKEYRSWIERKANEHLAAREIQYPFAIVHVSMETPKGEDFPELVGTTTLDHNGPFKVIVRLRPM